MRKQLLNPHKPKYKGIIQAWGNAGFNSGHLSQTILIVDIESIDKIVRLDHIWITDNTEAFDLFTKGDTVEFDATVASYIRQNGQKDYKLCPTVVYKIDER